MVLALNEASEKGGYLERYYKLSFWASMVVGGAFAFSPLSPLAIVNEFTPSSQFLQRAFGLGTVFMLAPAQFVLLDAASRGRLGGGTFKKLNLSVAAAIAGIDAMTVYTFAAATRSTRTRTRSRGRRGGYTTTWGRWRCRSAYSPSTSTRESSPRSDRGTRGAGRRRRRRATRTIVSTRAPHLHI